MVSVLKQIKPVPKTGKQQTAKPMMGKTKQTARKSTGGRSNIRSREQLEQLVQMAAAGTGTSRQLSVGRRTGGRIPAASTAATAGSRSSSTSSAASRAAMTRGSAQTQTEHQRAEAAAAAVARKKADDEARLANSAAGTCTPVGVSTSTRSSSTRRTSVLLSGLSGPNNEQVMVGEALSGRENDDLQHPWTRSTKNKNQTRQKQGKMVNRYAGASTGPTLAADGSNGPH